MAIATSRAGTCALRRLIVSVSSLDPALAFYQQVLGLRLVDTTAELAWLATTDGSEVMLHQRPARPSDAAVAIGFAVDDPAETVRRWQDRGGTVIDPPEVQPWGEFMAVVRDPDGHVVCISGPST
jgi:predicted enzyme related to lactoylglutathione lyase